MTIKISEMVMISPVIPGHVVKATISAFWEGSKTRGKTQRRRDRETEDERARARERERERESARERERESARACV